MHRWLCSASSLKMCISGARYYMHTNLPSHVVGSGGCYQSLRLFSRVHGARYPSAMVGEMHGSVCAIRRTISDPPRAAATTQNGFKTSIENDPEGGFASKHFDFQDVDADRLTHFYWDRNEDGNPYQVVPEFQWMGEDEFEQDNLTHVSMEDRKYLISEYL
ncbi:unnamed protein product [Phytomonas sp. EM1]|nr:unnamed protein product [Phytomonas sp. EM1]|eukprot:CCW61759.1 unnamed protein product [Phytomonas sp. isolate EM1]